MPYVVITETAKTKRPDLSAPIYYGRIWGCFSDRAAADTFPDFESAQPTVKTLRGSGLPFTYAIEIR